MHHDLLDILRCPYCGTPLSIVENGALERNARNGPSVDSGVLGCECCAFPIVDGIPVLMSDDPTRSAMHTLEEGRADDALIALLGLDEQQGAAFLALRSTGSPATYLEMLAVLCHDAEADYLAYRLSDPSFLTSEAVITALAQAPRPGERRALDVCGGAGHLTRVLSGQRSPSNPDLESGTVLVDLSYWKLWLAAHFTSPGCVPVCCDANHPLPFARDSFATALLSDALPYIWHKRLLAEELMRLVGPEGVVVMPHLHSANGENFSAGNTLTPAAYRDLLAPHRPRLFSDRLLFEDYLVRRRVDLTVAASPHDLGDESSFTLVASRDTRIFRQYEVPDESRVMGELRVNPLYQVEHREGSSILTLAFPTPEYAQEFSECRRYLPDKVTVRADLSGLITPARVGPDYAELRHRRVLLDTPPHYC